MATPQKRPNIFAQGDRACFAGDLAQEFGRQRALLYVSPWQGGSALCSNGPRLEAVAKTTGGHWNPKNGGNRPLGHVGQHSKAINDQLVDRLSARGICWTAAGGGSVGSLFESFFFSFDHDG